MTIGLAALFERADCKDYSSFTKADIERWGLEISLPFIKPATTPETIICPGCHEACQKPVRKHAGSAFIWCDESPDLGHITLESEELKTWRLDMQTLAKTVSELLGWNSTQEIIPHRAYDLGMLDGNTLFLLRGIEWEDNQKICQDARIQNASPLLISLSPTPSDLALPAIWMGQLLTLKAGKLVVSKERLAPAIRHKTILEVNVFRQDGKQWRVCYQGKEIFMPDSKGMTYIQFLLQHSDRDVAAIELQGLRDQKPITDDIITDTDLSPDMRQDVVIDQEAIQQITQRLKKLKTTNSDSAEIPKLQAYIRQSTHGGKSKAFKDANEKARQAVTATVSRAISAINKQHTFLGTHLKNSIQQGKIYRYSPEIPTNWH
jgi:hypothetical protein